MAELAKPDLKCKIRTVDYRRRELGAKRSKAVLTILEPPHCPECRGNLYAGVCARCGVCT